MGPTFSAHASVENAIREGIAVHQRLLDELIPTIIELADVLLSTFQRGGRLFLIGNGGSAAEAQHISTEFVGRFKRQRPPLPVVALTTDASLITAVGNDFDFSQVFSRQVEALVGSDDTLVAMSTSGTSANVLAAVQMASQKGATTVGFSGSRQGLLDEMVDFALNVPSIDTQRIQEGHLLIWHILCDLVDAAVADQEIETPE